MSTFIGGGVSTAALLAKIPPLLNSIQALRSGAARSGNQTYGLRARALSPVRIKGALIYHVASGTETVNVGLYPQSGAAHRTQTRSLSATGLYKIEFATPYDAALNEELALGWWVSGGGFTTAYAASTNLPQHPSHTLNAGGYAAFGIFAEPGYEGAAASASSVWGQNISSPRRKTGIDFWIEGFDPTAWGFS